MNCQEARAQMPLWVEGDLAAGTAAAVAAHLAGCPGCRGAAEALRASQRWLKEPDPAPFAAADRAELRQAVLRQLRAEAQPRPAAVRFRPLWAGLAAALGVAVLIGLRHPGPVPQVAAARPLQMAGAPTVPEVAAARPLQMAPAPPVPQVAATHPIQMASALTDTRAAVPFLAASSPTRVSHARPRPRPVPSPPSAEAPAPTEPALARIEFLAGKDAIRIIWLARTAAPETQPQPL